MDGDGHIEPMTARGSVSGACVGGHCGVVFESLRQKAKAARPV
jgi:hypothetical protein